MLTFRDMTAADRAIVLPMVESFYRSDAVEHPVPRDRMERSFAAATDPGETSLRGVLLLQEDMVAGFLYLSPFYSCEVGGMCIMVEELFVKEQFRAQGLGRQAMEWIWREYPQCRRVRLEVTDGNAAAIALYQKCGFTYLRYDQMALDRVEE